MINILQECILRDFNWVELLQIRQLIPGSSIILLEDTLLPSISWTFHSRFPSYRQLLILQLYFLLSLSIINTRIEQKHIIDIFVKLRIEPFINDIGSDICHLTIGKPHFIFKSINTWILVLPTNWIAIDISLAPNELPPGDSVPSGKYDGSI